MPNQQAIRGVLEQARAEKRQALTAEEAKALCDAYGIATPAEGTADSASGAGELADRIGYPVVVKVVSPDILHKTDAGCVVAGVADREAAARAYDDIVAAAKRHDPNARIQGVLVQKQLEAAQEVIVGAVTDPTFGKLVAFGLGGVLVEVLRDVTFRLAPTTREHAAAMLEEISGAAVLGGVRGRPAVDKDALVDLILKVGRLVEDFPAIAELDLNPVFATEDGATAVDVRVLLDFAPAPPRPRPSRADILAAMTRIMQPNAVAVIGASAGEGKIGNSVMRNLIDGGFEGAIHPIHPKADEILGRRCYASVADVPGEVDVAVFCIPAPLVAGALAECGAKGVPGAVLIPSGFAEIGEHELQAEVVRVAR